MPTNCWSWAQLNIATREKPTARTPALRKNKTFIDLPLRIEAGFYHSWFQEQITKILVRIPQDKT